MKRAQIIRSQAVLAVVTVMVLLCLTSAAQAADGDLDPTFGSGGKVLTDFGSPGDVAFAVASQADGKVVAAGISDAAGSFDFALARYNPDGSLDASFGSGGKVLTDFGSQVWDIVSAVAIQPDGKIVAAGVSRAANGYDWDIALVRYNPDGSLDASFGAGGKVRTGLLGGFANAVALQPDGRIVVAGSSWSGVTQFALLRYNTDGTVDSGFGTAGIALADVGDGDARSIALQPDGKIVAGGYSRSSGLDVALVRFNSDGSLDASFGANGLVLTDFGGASSAFAVAIQSDGKIVTTGANEPSICCAASDFALARYQADGSPDTSFGSGGKLLTDFDSQSSDEAHAVVIQSDGKIVIAGTATGISRGGFAVLRYNANGSLDPTFGSGGKVLPGVFGRIWAAAVPLQPDGRIVVAGDFAGDFALVRLVTEKGAQEQVEDLIGLVDSYQLGKLGTSLHDKLVTVQRFLAAGKPRQAEDNLEAFIAQVEAQRGKGLTQEQADALETAAQRIIDVIES